MSLSARFMNIKKYSNIILFEKRANYFESKKKALFHIKHKKTKRQKSAFSIKLKDISFSCPFLSDSTISHFSDLNIQLSSGKRFVENCIIKNNNNSNNKKKSHDEQKSIKDLNNLFLTESPTINSYKQRSSVHLDKTSNIKMNKINKSLINRFKKSYKYINSNINGNKDKNYLLNNNFSSIDNANILLSFQNEKNIIENKDKNKAKVKIKNNIINKNKLINIKKINLVRYMEKTQEFKLYEYTSKINKESYKREKENKQNKLEYFNDMLKSLEKDKKLLNVRFIDKLGDYIKFINSQKERERAKNNDLINNIIKYKNEIKQINNKIRKKTINKKNILKWIYFLIQLKEKKLVLPSYYRTILESNKPTNIKNDNSLIKENFDEIIKVSKHRRFYSFDVRRSKKYFTKKKQTRILESEFNSENGLFFNYEIDLDNPVNIKEIIKIKNYKKYPIYNTVDEFKDAFIFYDNKNISKMKYYYNLRMQIYYLNKELLLIKEKTKENKINLDNSIKIKQKELNEINDIGKYKYNLIQKLNKNRYNDKIFSNNFIQNKYYKFKYDKSQEENKLNLFKKINILFNTCKLLKLNTNYELKKDTKNRKKNDNIDLNEILSKLKYISYITDYLLVQFKIYNSNEYGQKELLNKLKNEIEKNHKLQYASEQRLHNQKKFLKLKKKLEERNNKIYFLPYRKVEFSKNKNDENNYNNHFEEKKIQKLFFDDLI